MKDLNHMNTTSKDGVGRYLKTINIMSAFDINDSLLVLCFMGWGVLMALCLFLAIIRALFSCIQKICGDYSAGVRRSSGDETLELYRTMSSERKEEIDDLRKDALLRFLNRFTLVRLQCHIV